MEPAGRGYSWWDESVSQEARVFESYGCKDMYLVLATGKLAFCPMLNVLHDAGVSQPRPQRRIQVLPV